MANNKSKRCWIVIGLNEAVKCCNCGEIYDNDVENIMENVNVCPKCGNKNDWLIKEAN